MIPVFEAIAEELKTRGVDTVFGLMSDDVLQLLASIDARGIRFVSTRHENTAVMAAAGYARAAGRVGVVVIGRGPGLANAMHAIASASRTGAPVLLITGAEPAEPLTQPGAGPDLKDFAGLGVLQAAGVSTVSVRHASEALACFDAALSQCMRGRLVALLVPEEVQRTMIDERTTRDFEEPAVAALPARPEAVDAAAALLAKSSRPMILAGLGVYHGDARAQVEALAERTGALIYTTLKAKDLFRGHPFNMGVLGTASHSMARRYADQADCVIAVGASLNRWTTTGGTSLPDAPVIQIDRERGHIGRWWHADVGLVGDAALALEQLTAAIPEKSAADMPFRTNAVRDEIAAFNPQDDFRPLESSHTIDPRAVTVALDGLLPPARQLVFDGGNHTAAWAYISVQAPNDFTHVVEIGSIGLGMGTAIGVACARPDNWTVAFEGDGALLMTLGELETVIREQLPMVVVVMNDAAYGAEVHQLRGHKHSTATAKFFDMDFAALAATMGYEVATVRSGEDLDACADLFGEVAGPTLIDCKINGDYTAPWLAG